MNRGTACRLICSAVRHSHFPLKVDSEPAGRKRLSQVQSELEDWGQGSLEIWYFRLDWTLGMAAPLFRGKSTLDLAALSKVTCGKWIRGFSSFRERGWASEQTSAPGLPKATLSHVITVSREVTRAAHTSRDPHSVKAVWKHRARCLQICSQ